ncbi:aldo/keto reductase [Jeotgalibacillus proteolyticus]|uniref:Oxidoreductase n=1 Tax=Jeotgalibacillus proteolyticus TaxID=2082395 RepID=A0A2S5GE68_9BACL|nr:aldo/keto reductase [Jeotgalibacillus proteolyticus]PPA71320.1 oxidoreductase [Jeotgalibacillus proteolyticus]
MEKRQIGSSELKSSILGLGCMSLGRDEKKAQAIIEAALEGGITYFDTADLYDFGVNEEIVGKSLKHVRDEVVIATKVGNRWEEGKEGWQWDPSKSYITEQVKSSLKRLQVDYIDLYQLHGGTLDDPIDETIEAFEQLKKEGYIREYGISSIRPNVIKEYAEKSSIVSNMMQYSLLDRRPEEQALPILNENNISVITRGPLAKGILTEKLLSKVSDSVKEDGYLHYTFEALEYTLETLYERFSSMRTMNELALKFNAANPAVASIITGASSPDQIKRNIEAISGDPLSEEEYELLRELTNNKGYAEHRL